MNVTYVVAMETQFRHPPRQIRVQRTKRLKILVISSVLFCVLLFSITKAPQLAKSVVEKTSRQFSAIMRLEQVEWEEVGTTNLSRFVTRDLLWKTSGLQIGDEMLPLKLEALEEKLRTIPFIESVQFQKKLPSTLVVRYTAHHARAAGLKKGRLWSVSSDGDWIAPIGKLNLDLPVIVGSNSVPLALEWINAIEREARDFTGVVHEINVAGLKSRRLTILIDLKYQSRAAKVTLLAMGPPQEGDFTRLKQVVQYLIKNNILVSTIDLRPGKKVVVNVGKHP